MSNTRIAVQHESVPGKIAVGHPCTYAHYIASPSQSSCSAIRWRYNGPGSTAEARTKDNLQGEISLHHGSQWQGEMAMEDDRSTPQTGDGTVPEVSARGAAAHVAFCAGLAHGYAHADSYDQNEIREITLYAIARMGAEAAARVFGK